MVMLENWSKNAEKRPEGAESKYHPGTVARNAKTLLSGNLAAGLPAVVERAELCGADVESLVAGDGALQELYQNCLASRGLNEPQPVHMEDLKDVVSENHLKILAVQKNIDAHAAQVESLIGDMPAGTARDYIVAVATNGTVTKYDELKSMEQFVLHPAMAILAGLQCADTVMGNRVWLNTGNFGTLAGNLYVLALGGSGTGKTQMLDFFNDVLRESGYGHAYTDGKSHSGGGFYNNFLMRGPVVFQTSDEAKDWLSCMEVSGGGMVANQTSLNAIILSLFNQSRMGGSINPANLMSDRNQGGVIKQADPVIEPHVNILFIGTHDLQQSLSDKLIEDGYLARFIILIVPEEDNAEESLVKKVHSQLGDGTGTHLKMLGVKAVAQFLKELDSDLMAANRGNSVASIKRQGQEFMTGEAGEVKAYNVLFKELQESRLEEDRWCSIVNMDMEVANALIEAGMPLVKMSKNYPVLKPISNREVEKIQRVALTLTILNDPAADKLDVKMVKFAAKLVKLLQKPWIDRLVKSEVNLISRTNTYYPILDKLRAELTPERPLYQAADGLSTTELSNSGRAWRELLKGLRSSAGGLREDAVKVLDMLGIVRVKVVGGKGFTFFHPEHAPDLSEE
jgi:hypothetical protein